MSSLETTFEATQRVAERTVEILRAHQIDAVIIGAVALAVHQYPRDTEDFDLAVAIPTARLATLAVELRAQGWEAELREPDAQDPLGGLIDIRAPGADLVQVINFDNAPGGFPRLVHDAVRLSTPLAEGSALRVTDLNSLIVFKLYAGGHKSTLDILELLERNQPVDLEALKVRCKSYRLDKSLDRVLKMANEK